jgi:hypothetical protein
MAWHCIWQQQLPGVEKRESNYSTAGNCRQGVCASVQYHFLHIHTHTLLLWSISAVGFGLEGTRERKLGDGLSVSPERAWRV